MRTKRPGDPATPETITEARMASGMTYIVESAYHIRSSVRTMPYAEFYRMQNADVETPIEHLIRTADASAVELPVQ